MIPLSQPWITEWDKQSILDVMDSKHLSLWPVTKRFEELCSSVAWTTYASAVNSWTSWLHLIVAAMWLGENDAAFCPSFTFVATANCLLFEKALPLFIDVDPDVYNIDPIKIREYIDVNCTFDGNTLYDNITKRNVRAIIPMHCFWHITDMDPINEIAKEYNLQIIEDAAEAIWSEYNGKSAWQLWDASIFAFYPNKQMTTWEWWVITTNDKNIYEYVHSAKNQWRWNSMKRLTHDKLWYNYRLSDINSALWVSQISRIDQIIDKRNQVAERYNELFSEYENLIKTPMHKDYCTVYSRFVYVVEILSWEEIWKVINSLMDKWIQSKNYFSPVHSQEFYSKDVFNDIQWDVPVTELVSSRSLALPFYSLMSQDDCAKVASTLISILKK